MLAARHGHSAHTRFGQWTLEIYEYMLRAGHYSRLVSVCRSSSERGTNRRPRLPELQRWLGKSWLVASGLVRYQLRTNC
jgi:hypothetical protein